MVLDLTCRECGHLATQWAYDDQRGHMLLCQAHTCDPSGEPLWPLGGPLPTQPGQSLVEKFTRRLRALTPVDLNGGELLLVLGAGGWSVRIAGFYQPDETTWHRALYRAALVLLDEARYAGDVDRVAVRALCAELKAVAT